MKKYIFSIAAFAAFSVLLSSCINDAGTDIQQKEIEKGDTAHYTAFVTQEATPTRVAITDHVPERGAVVKWQTDDKIWLYLSDTYRLGSSFNNVTTPSTRAKFYFEPGLGNASYKVNYCGHTTRTDGRYVTIHPLQWQGVANNTDHLQYVGDCAEGTANRTASGTYSVQMRRLPAYLCIMPYCTNELIRPGAKVTKIVVRSDNAITGTFDIAKYGLNMAYVSNPGYTIENGLNNGNGFSLENNAPNQALSAAYIVMAPGVHTLSIDYYYTSPQTPVQLKLTKNMAARNYLPNTITDIYANLDQLAYEPKFYMWDARENIAVDRYTPIDWPTINTDLRWCNEQTGSATQSASTAPNINQIQWYLNSDIYFDSNTTWTYQGIVHYGGIWLKKLSVQAAQRGEDVNNWRWSFQDGKNYIDEMAAGRQPYIQGSVSYGGNAHSGMIQLGKPSSPQIGYKGDNEAYYMFIPAVRLFRKDGNPSYYSLNGRQECGYWIGNSKGDMAFYLKYFWKNNSGYGYGRNSNFDSMLTISTTDKKTTIMPVFQVQ